MHKTVSTLAGALLALAALTVNADTRLSIAATAVPQAEILEHVKPALSRPCPFTRPAARASENRA